MGRVLRGPHLGISRRGAVLSAGAGVRGVWLRGYLRGFPEVYVSRLLAVWLTAGAAGEIRGSVRPAQTKGGVA